MEKNEKYIIQSNGYTSIRNDYGIYAQRLLILIAEAMQYRFNGIVLKSGEIKLSEMILDYEFNISQLKIGNGTNNNQYIKEQLNIIAKTIIHESNKKYEMYAPLFTRLKYDKETTKLKVSINQSLWDIFAQISNGYKRYQLETALSFSSTYATRLYQMLKGNTKPITYKIEQLKEMFVLENKYPKPTDFITYVIKSAIKEINEKSEIEVKYTPETLKTGKGRPKIYAITFEIKERPDRTNFNLAHSEINRKMGLSIIPTLVKTKLMQAYNFTEQGIKANADIIYDTYALMKNPAFNQWLDKKRATAMKAKNPQGYIIQAMKNELEENAR